jgi:hypothetical protein
MEQYLLVTLMEFKGEREGFWACGKETTGEIKVFFTKTAK